MEKINSNMSIKDMILTMAEGNPGAMVVLMDMLQNHRSFMDILLCDSLDIRGYKIYMLNSDCCNKNTDKFNRTLMMLRCGIFSKEQIHNNFELVRAIPFIDDSIEIDGIPPYNEDFGPTNEKWNEFCQIQKEAFTKKLSEAMEKQKKI